MCSTASCRSATDCPSPHASALPPAPSPRPQDIKLADRGLVWNTDLIEAVELENLLANAAITMHSAEKRK